MMKTKILSAVILTALMFTACKKEDEKIDLPGDLTQTSLEESIYTSQLYFDMVAGEVVQSIAPDSWDLGFDADGLITNPGQTYGVYKSAAASVTGDITIPEDAEWVIDNPDGSVSGRAFYNWDASAVYLLGKNSHGSFTPVYAVKVSQGSSSFNIEYATFGETTSATATITVNSDAYYTRFSFTNSSTDEEPNKGDWQLLFTPYTTALESGTLYPVKGVVLNPGMSVYADNLDFETVDKTYAAALSFTQDQEGVGYNWKSYTDGAYVTNSEMVYILKDSKGTYFKLRFLDFYNLSGEKGYPTFEFQKL